MKKTNKIIAGISIFIFIILFLNFICIKSDKAFNIIGFRTYTVVSGSMEPKLYPGDIVLVINKNKSDFKVDDVITFEHDNDIVTHRIIDIQDDTYITKGDNNDAPDPFTVKYEDIIGKVLFHIPKVGYIIKFLSNPLVIAIEMIILAIFVIRLNKK